MSLQQQTVVVLGGASGIGRAVAVLALLQQARVFVHDLSAEGIDRLTQEHPEITATRLDATDEPAVRQALGSHERLDHVYVAAGSTRLGQLLDDEPLAAQLATLHARLLASAIALRAAAPRLRPGGSVTLTGGVSTDRPFPGAWVPVVATAAAEQLARVAALELAPLRVNAIAPGWTDTPMWDSVLGDQKEQVFAQVREQLLVKRLATAAEVARGVLFLMENESVTGEVLHVDGGRRLT